MNGTISGVPFNVELIPLLFEGWILHEDLREQSGIIKFIRIIPNVEHDPKTVRRSLYFHFNDDGSLRDWSICKEPDFESVNIKEIPKIVHDFVSLCVKQGINITFKRIEEEDEG